MQCYFLASHMGKKIYLRNNLGSFSERKVGSNVNNSKPKSDWGLIYIWEMVWLHLYWRVNLVEIKFDLGYLSLGQFWILQFHMWSNIWVKSSCFWRGSASFCCNLAKFSIKVLGSTLIHYLLACVGFKLGWVYKIQHCQPRSVTDGSEKRIKHMLQGTDSIMTLDMVKVCYFL